MTGHRYQDPGDRIPALSIRPRRAALTDGQLVRRIVDRLPRPPRRIVDVGAGDGRLLPALTAIADEVVLVEPDSSRLARAERRAAERAITNVTFVERDAATFAASATAGFDLALCSHVIQHVSRRERGRVVAALHRLVADGGHALVTFPASSDRRARYLVSRCAADGASVTTQVVSAGRFDDLADGSPGGGPSDGLPVWHAPVPQVIAEARRAGFDLRAVATYRVFDFELHDAAGACRPASASDTALLVAPRRRSRP